MFLVMKSSFPLPLFLSKTANQIWNKSHHYFPVGILYICWIFACFIINQYYSTSFYTGLTVREYNDPIDTVDDLIRLLTDNESQIITGFQFAFNQKLLTAQQGHGIFHQIGIKLNRSRSQGKIIYNPFRLFSMLAEERKSVCLEVKNLLQMLKMSTDPETDSLVHIGSESLFQFHQSLVFERPHSPLINPFNMA